MKTLDYYLDYEQPTKYIIKTEDYNDSYKIPVLTAGKSFILGYTNEEDGVFRADKEPVIIFDDFTTSIQYVDFPFKVKSSALKILHAKENADIKYFYYLMKAINFNAITHKRYWISEYSKLEIDEIELNEQKKISKKMDEINDAIKNRDENISILDKMILSKFNELFKSEIKSKNYCKLESTIDEIVDNRGKNPPYYVESGIPIIDNFMIGNNQYIDLNQANRFIDDKLLNTFIRKKIKSGDLLITLVGAGIGNLGIIDDENAVIIQNTIGLRFKSSVTAEFMYYQLLLLKNEIINLNRSAAQPSVRVGNLMELEVLVPDIKIQKEFSNFVNSIKKIKKIVNSDRIVMNDIFNLKFYEYIKNK